MDGFRFVKNPDYPDDWEEKERKRLGDCFGCGLFLGGCMGAVCRKTGMPLRLPVHGCPGKPVK